VRDYPNLQAVLDGRVSADAGQWPLVRVELRRLLEACAQDQREVERWKGLYHELLYAVGMKYDGETRHQTALRYIQERESRFVSGYGTLREGRGKGEG